ncbi:MAG: rod shape-determining protein RodA [Spirochaetes bacterium]|nr:rod shape-determining protein RodA [Spirochaetota bacterium]MBN2770664.1 rod shape-determining protein RodA [Spirochaetota bacterium]
MLFRSDFNKLDYVLFIAVIMVIAFGIVTIYSAGYDSVLGVNNNMYKRQIIWFVLGFSIMLGLTFLDYRIFGDYSLQIFGFVLVILILTSFFGPRIRNMRAWISFGAFSIQPSEFMKLATIIVLAKYLELRERDIYRFKELLVPTVIVLIPMLFIMKQPDFGTAMIFVPVLFAMLFAAGADVTHLVAIILIAVIGLFVPMSLTYYEWVNPESESILLKLYYNGGQLYLVSVVFFVIASVTFLLHLFRVNKYFRRIYIPSYVFSIGLFVSVFFQRYMKDYQKKRILVFLKPDLDPLGSGYNVIQSKIAIGSGGFFGKGFMEGTQTRLGFLPEKTSDFIVAVIAEEWGFVGAMFLLLALFTIVFRGLKISMYTKDKFGALLVIGISALFFVHFIINIGMVIGFMPVTGLPLTFVSYGGSNLLSAMMGVGLLLSVSMHRSSM